MAVTSGLSEPLTDGGLRPLSAAEVDEALRLATSPAASAVPGGTAASTPGPGGPAGTDAPTTAPSSPTAASPSASPPVSPSASPSVPPSAAPPAASPSGRSRAIDTPGGSVIARCENGLVTLRSWRPAQGFQTDDAERGPARQVQVEFEAEERDVQVEISCSADGVPVHRLQP